MNDTSEVLGVSPAQIRAAGAYWTAREITQQPQLWPLIGAQVAADQALHAFLGPLLADPELRIVLIGAGSSSFIGRCLAPALGRARGSAAEAIATTDIVADPHGTLLPSGHTLVVHFARSGNSPESVAAMQLAEQRIARCAHLIVTCNADGGLRRAAAGLRQAYTVLLPEACNDQSFAMTSSFTGMALAAAIALRLLPRQPEALARLAGSAESALGTCTPLLANLVRAQFDRVVYLGSNELNGLAREAALKMLELTDGRVVSVADTPLGFRHGPKTIVNGSTLVVVFLSNDPYTRRYDLDLLQELRRDAVAGRVIALAGSPEVAQDRDTILLGRADPQALPAVLAGDLELCLLYSMFAQSLGFLRSLSLGLSPDNPNVGATVNRVVQGVTIHPAPPA